MTEIQTVWLNGGERDGTTNAPNAAAFTPTGDDPLNEDNRIPVGTAPLMPCIGIVAMPYPPDERGHAEGIVALDVGGQPAVCIAGRDTRSFKVCAKMQPGDTGMMSTGPNNAAQVLCKEKKRQVVASVQKKNGKQIMVTLDGENESLQVLANGAIFEINKDGDINASSPNGAHGWSLTNQGSHFRGTVILGGMKPTFAVAQVPPITGMVIPPGGGTVAAASGVWIGT